MSVRNLSTWNLHLPSPSPSLRLLMALVKTLIGPTIMGVGLQMVGIADPPAPSRPHTATPLLITNNMRILPTTTTIGLIISPGIIHTRVTPTIGVEVAVSNDTLQVRPTTIASTKAGGVIMVEVVVVGEAPGGATVTTTTKDRGIIPTTTAKNVRRNWHKRNTFPQSPFLSSFCQSFRKSKMVRSNFTVQSNFVFCDKVSPGEDPFL